MADSLLIKLHTYNCIASRGRGCLSFVILYWGGGGGGKGGGGGGGGEFGTTI